MKRQSESGLFNWIYDPIYFKQNISRKRREGKGKEGREKKEGDELHITQRL